MKQGDFSKELIEEFTQLLPQGLRQAELGPELLGGLNAYKQVKEQGIEAGELFKSYYEIQDVVQRYKEALATGQEQYVTPGTWKQLGKRIIDQYKTVVQAGLMDKVKDEQAKQFISGMGWMGDILQSGKAFSEGRVPLLDYTNLLMLKKGMGSTVATYTKGIMPLQMFYYKNDKTFIDFMGHMFSLEQNTMIAGQKKGQPPVLAQMMQQLSQEPEDQQQMAEIFSTMFGTLKQNTIKVIQETLGLDEASVQQQLSNLEDIFLIQDEFELKKRLQEQTLILETVEKLTGASRELTSAYLRRPFEEYIDTGKQEQKKRFLQLLPGWLIQFRQAAQGALGEAGLKETQDLYYNKLVLKLGMTPYFTSMFLYSSASAFASDWMKKGRGFPVPDFGVETDSHQRYYIDLVSEPSREASYTFETEDYYRSLEELSQTIGHKYDVFVRQNLELSAAIQKIVDKVAGTTDKDLLEYLSYEQSATDMAQDIQNQVTSGKTGQLRNFVRQTFREVNVPLAARLNQFGLPALQSELVISPYIKGKLLARPVLEQSLMRGSKILASTQDFVIRQGRSSQQLLKLSASELIAKGQNTDLSAFEYKKVLANLLENYQPYQRQGYRGLKLGDQSKIIGPMKKVYAQQAEFAKTHPTQAADVLKYGPFNIEQVQNIIRQFELASISYPNKTQYIVANVIMNPEYTKGLWTEEEEAYKRIVLQVRQQLTGQTEYAPFIKPGTNIDEFIKQMFTVAGSLENKEDIAKMFNLLGIEVKPESIRDTTGKHIRDVLTQVTELIDYDLLKQYTGISDIKVHFGGMLSARIAGAQSLDRIAIQSPNRIGSMIAFKRAGQEFSPLKYFLQAGGELDEYKRTIGSNLVEAADITILPKAGAESLAEFLKNFQTAQFIDLSRLDKDIDIGFGTQQQELQRIPTIFPALMMSEEDLKKLLSKVNEITGNVPYSFAGDQILSTKSARSVLGYVQMTQKGQRVLRLPKQYKLTGFGREKGMVRELPFELYAVLTTQEGKEIQVPILYMLGSQRSRLNKFTVQALGSIGQQKFLGYNVPEWTGTPQQDIQEFLKQALLAGPNLRPKKLIVKAGKEFEITDVNQLFIAHRAVINLSQDFSSSLSPTRQIQLQSQLTGLLSGYTGLFTTPYPIGTTGRVADLLQQTRTLAELIRSKKSFKFGYYTIPTLGLEKAGDQSLQDIDEARQFEQYKRAVNEVLIKEGKALPEQKQDILKQTIAVSEILRRASQTEYVKEQGRFITLEELKSVEYQEQLFKQIQRTGGIKIYIGQTKAGEWLTMELSDIFFRSDIGEGQRLVLSDVGNKLRKYFIGVGQYLTGKGYQRLYAQLFNLQAQMSSQLARQYFKKSGLYVVGRFSTLADYTDEALKAMEGQQAKDVASLMYAKGQQMPQARMRQLMSLIKSTLAEYKTKNISKEKLTMQLTYAQQVRYIRAEGSKLIVEVPELAKEAVAEEEIIKSVKELLEGEVEVQYVPWERSLETALQALTEIQPRKGFGVARAGKASAFQFMTREPQLTYRPLVRIQYIDESEYIGVPQKIAQLMGGDDDQDIVSQLPSVFIDNDVLRQKQQTNPRLAQILTQGQIDIPTSQAIFQSMYARGKIGDEFMQQLKSLFRRGG